MTPIETIVVVILSLMTVPGLCRRLGRPGLVNAVYMLLGLAIGGFVSRESAGLLREGGRFGFVFLLFLIGLEIEIPRWFILKGVLARALAWTAVQVPLVLLLAWTAGLPPASTLVAGAGLLACSVGIVYPAWKALPAHDLAAKLRLLHVMILVEVICIFVLAVLSAGMSGGWRGKDIVLRVAGIAGMVLLIYVNAARITRSFQWILEKTTHWRAHLVVLLVLLIVCVGERLGLDAPKTAFFLGLAMSRVHHDGADLETYLAPIAQGLLVPVFFFGLGLSIPVDGLLSATGLYALGAAFVLIGGRRLLARRLLADGSGRAHLLLSPNLTIAAIGAGMLGEHAGGQGVTWLLLTGLFMTIIPLLLLPATREPEAIA